MQNTRRGKTSRKNRSPILSFLNASFRRILLYLSPFVIAIAVGYLAYEDYIVRQQFEGKRWALPARVYASPVELFAGYELDAGRLEWLLEQLKYRSDPGLSSQGTYFRKGDVFVLKTRDFRFWDKVEASRHIQVRFDVGQISSVTDSEESKPLALLRLDPVQIGTFYPALKEDRVLIKLGQAPELLLKALFSVEDRDFYEHFGISPRGILRAMWANIRAGGIVQGGSTLTQQLVKNFFLSSERTWWRKLNELVMALVLEARYSKDEILEAYLNEIYLGQDGARAIHGFGLASQYYFSRSLEELELHHVALLVSLVRGPSYYDPFRWPAKAKKRRDLVLDEMVEQGQIPRGQADESKAKPLDVVKNPHQAISRYPAFLDLIKRQLQQEYRPEDLTSEGLRLFTTLDVFAQHYLESAVETTLRKLDRQTRTTQLETAAVITRRATGEVAALMGSRDPQDSGFNRALDAQRQIGSLYKPVVYLTALEDPQRYTLMSPLQDSEIRIKNPGGGPWAPKNYDNQEHGIVPLHKALAHSFNLATVHLGMDVGVASTAETLRKLGVEKSVELVPSLLLGTATLTPFEVAQMYQTLASDGFVVPLRAIQAVVSQEGKTLQRYGLSVRQSIDSAAVYLVDTILQEVMRDGTGKPAYAYLPSHFDTAGKTGTTNDLRDSWFAGFTGDYLGVVWVGRDDNQPAKLTGAQGALPVWASTMGKVSRESLELEPPENVELVWIDRVSGLRSDENCATAIRYPFIAGSAPTAVSSCGQLSNPTERVDSWFRRLF
ncbi:penicillin-binding protein 1B [Methylocaldum sp.]|uniref:penicillin-binding protein 1B n=1 Tax=Methylocaldum sp. TaxID=1969727 RepID=UPI002D29F905|nr:penicillin-binding protein 1B [Methylocaldum sp.]HYE36553.1 penicillin-binding protein 1B [Methylocaldum sp.]